MQPKLPELFGLLPKAPVTVEAIPDFAKAAATHYVRGTPDGKRPGVWWWLWPTRPSARWCRRSRRLPRGRARASHADQHRAARCRTCRSSALQRLLSAYTEGWALYAEELGKEIGFYKDPVSDYGRLNSELFRAVRLVVDTGIHDKGWTREQVIAYMHANDVNDALAQTETDRYIAWPGQALAYKMGQLTIRKLREEAKAQLGPQVRHQGIPR